MRIIKIPKQVVLNIEATAPMNPEFAVSISSVVDVLAGNATSINVDLMIGAWFDAFADVSPNEGAAIMRVFEFNVSVLEE